MSRRRIHLSAVGPEFAGQSWTSGSRLRVGRVSGLEIRLDHSSVSRHHAEVAPTDEGWIARDLGSTNGTFVNGLRIGQAGRDLRAGDVLQFGRISTEVAFTAEAPEGPPSEEIKTAGIVTPPNGVTNLKETVLANGGDLDVVIQTVTALAQAVELRDKYTGGHTQRVTNYSLLLAERLHLPSMECRLLQIGVPLHDIGKIGVDDAVLRKAGSLMPDEFESMRSHTTRGAAILEGIPGLAAVLPIVRSHHERWDGRGYPDALAGEAIPLLARVVAVADSFDAMTSDRPYRKGLPLARAFSEIAKGSGTQFDPRCAAAFLALRPYLEDLLRKRQALSQTHEQFALGHESRTLDRAL
jgi:HD-GYP domain-containing protein (c-di-GMP phosphodiesterase class II)